jgi:hypothetical protein
MNFYNVKSLLLLLSVVTLFSFQVTGQSSENEDDKQTLEMGIQILKRYFYEDNQWYITKPSVAKDVKGLINFIEDEPIDTVISNIFKSFSQDQTYVFRLPENVEDSLTVPGFYPFPQVQQRIANINKELEKEFENRQVQVPASLLTNLEEKLNLIPAGKGMQLFTQSVYTMPADLQIPEVIPDSVLNSAEEFRKLVRLDSIRTVYVEQKRINYNDSITAVYVDSLNNVYGRRAYQEELGYQIKRFSDSVKVNNYNVLREYNEAVVNSVNDSISLVLETLAQYADFIDSTRITMYNLSGNSTEIGFKKRRRTVCPFLAEKCTERFAERTCEKCW